MVVGEERQQQGVLAGEGCRRKLGFRQSSIELLHYNLGPVY